MPFRLMNVGATFQRAMDIAFVGEKDKFVLIYLDDITVYSSNHEEHMKHLKRVFLKGFFSRFFEIEFLFRLWSRFFFDCGLWLRLKKNFDCGLQLL